MPELWRRRDQWGRDVVLTSERWNGHIVAEHPILRGQEAAVAEAVASPDRVMYDAEVIDGECFYQAGVLPRARRARYLKVAVHFRRDPSTGAMVGTVSTAFPTDRIKSRGRPRWP